MLDEKTKVLCELIDARFSVELACQVIEHEFEPFVLDRSRFCIADKNIDNNPFLTKIFDSLLEFVCERSKSTFVDGTFSPNKDYTIKFCQAGLAAKTFLNENQTTLVKQLTEAFGVSNETTQLAE